MKHRYKILLAVDGIVNLVLGAVLLLSPAGLIELLGLPSSSTYFYASILGAVIFGIGLALLLELYGAPSRIRGLGLGGAIAINLCGGGAVLVWLLTGVLSLPLRGQLILWTAGILVLVIGVAEIAAKSWKYEE
jgi:hypothetical protein